MLKPFTRSRDEVIWFLESVLHGKMDCRAWDTFISIPIKGDSELEAVRQACEDLAEEEIIEDDGRINHKTGAKVKLEAVLSNLKSNE